MSFTVGRGHEHSSLLPHSFCEGHLRNLPFLQGDVQSRASRVSVGVCVFGGLYHKQSLKQLALVGFTFQICSEEKKLPFSDSLFKFRQYYMGR